MLRRSTFIAQAAAAVAATPEASGSQEKDGKNPQQQRQGTGDSNKAAGTTTTTEQQKHSLPPLLGYPIRRAAASEMLYGGVRTAHLNQRPFALHYTHSAALPPPSLDRERHDLQLEMQLPRDGKMGYNNLSMHIQRQAGYDDGVDGEALGGNTHARSGFKMGEYFSDLFHPERHHNSSLPYAANDTNNVLGLRVFPLNMHVRFRVEGVRIRTEDLLERMRDSEMCARHGMPLQSPLPLHTRASLKQKERELAGSSSGGGTLYSGAIDPRRVTPSDAVDNGNNSSTAEQARRRHLRGGPSQPRREDLSILTRPQDIAAESNNTTGGVPDIHQHHSTSGGSTRAAALQHFYTASNTIPVISINTVATATTTAQSAASSSITRGHPQYWAPLQMLKPIGHAWSASVRSSGVRGPTMQLMQERLDQKGFGWKRKSRSLWQQDVDTAGFRPHRYF